ncbi:CGNR zinc finger domain-containing protein [Nocardia sp. alder85J]|uniref:CGNR zinc finger domain-containing protein n=1 Tax=Nocardia sp. alder85J TaxID=2862949 RepID=UPI001CD5E61D|nr:CGNR zinc finger domain-containing protein [Nocardia sp. alder85J]MCX4094997.1 CGNR zinc finger domain-containing protein [Nocardia sp. alder85J]
MLDPRPHLGEPLALDLLNTRWMTTDGPQDLLRDVAGLSCWLSTNGLAGPADEPTLHALRTTRDAIRAAVHGESIEALNEVLDRGRIRRTLTATGPADVPEIPAPEWRPGWLATDNLLHLLTEAPHRVKQCDHPHCILYFYDTSKNGTRRWHSMATCGNRVKAARHQAKKP